MTYFWVNQGSTFDQESVGECLWAPQRTKSGHTLPHWETMDDLQPGDVVITYAKPSLRGYAVVRSRSTPCERPYTAAIEYTPAQGGRIVFCTYTSLDRKHWIKKEDFLNDPLLTAELKSKSNPVLTDGGDATGVPSVAQKYLCQISDLAGRKLIDRLVAAGLPRPNEGAKAPEIVQTTVKLLIDARIGQGKFRADLLEAYDGRCPITGLGNPALLRASHIVPWCESSTAEKLDPQNGLLLAAGIDAAFDRALVAFDDDGRLITKLADAEQKAIGLLGPSRLPEHLLTPARRSYLARHRRKHA